MLAAPLWDPAICQFTGLLTVTDFIDILLHYRQTNKDVSNLAIRSIQEIMNDIPDMELQAFRSLDSDCTLHQACEQLVSLGDNFLPIVMAQDMRVLACITFTNILEHLVTHFREQRRLFDESIQDLRIGTYGDQVARVTRQQNLAEALSLMKTHKLGALPVVDENTGKVIGVYSHSDITFLTKATDAQDAVRNLELPLGDVLQQARQDVTTPDALFTCSPSHTLQSIFESFAQMRFNRLYVVDAEERLLGVVSARDLVQYFLQEV